MNSTTSRKAGERRTRAFARVLAFGLGLLTLGYCYQAVATARDGRSHAPPGRLIAVGGERLHLDCAGVGTPTVILEAGLGSSSVTWARVMPEVARFTRVCAYDRGGYAWSEQRPGSRDAKTLASELAALLTKAGESGPFVVAAHSFGGIVARVFVGQEPQAVQGVVLIDASHPAQFSKACTPACLPEELVRRSASMYRTTQWLAPFGALRLGGEIGLLPFQEAAAGLPAREAAIVAAELARTSYWQTSAAEFASLPVSTDQALAAGSLGDRLLRVVTAGNTYYSDELKALTGPIDPSAVTASWLTLQRDLLQLSTRSAQTIVPQASHVSLIADARYASSVVGAIRSVVDALQH